MLAADLNRECGVERTALSRRFISHEAEKAKAALRKALAAGKRAWLEDDYAASMQRAGMTEWMGFVLVTVDPQTSTKDVEPCDAVIYHGPGHQSRTRCRVKGPHTVHEAVYGDSQFAQWTDGQYLRSLKAAGVDPPSWVTEKVAMTGYFDEPPQFEFEDDEPAPAAWDARP
jgi:hypothetical protein